MFYAILLILASVLIAFGSRANELYKITKSQKDNVSEEFISAWYNMGGMNVLIFECGCGTFQSFLSGLGVIVAYIGLWLCALGNWGGGIGMFIGGAAVCVLIQFFFVKRMQEFTQKYGEETGQDPKDVFIRKTGPKHAVYMSVMIGVGKAVSFLLICSVVGILLYFFLKRIAKNTIYREENLERGIAFETLIDEDGNEWTCEYRLGDDFWVYEGPNGKKIQVNAHEMIEAEKKADYIQVGSYTFHQN